MTNLIFLFLIVTIDLWIFFPKKKKSVCCEYIFLKVTSSELFMNILARSFVVVELLAGLRNITWHFQVVYVMVFNLGSVYQLLKLLVGEDGHSPWMYRVLSAPSPWSRRVLAYSRRVSVLFLACVYNVFKQHAIWAWIAHSFVSE